MGIVAISMSDILVARKMRSTHFGKGIEANNTQIHWMQRTAPVIKILFIWRL